MKSASGMRGIIEMGFTLCVGPGLKKREWCSVKIKQIQAAAVAPKKNLSFLFVSPPPLLKEGATQQYLRAEQFVQGKIRIAVIHKELNFKSVETLTLLFSFSNGLRF